MTSDIVAAALAGLGPMIQQGSRKPVNQYAARRQFGDALLMQGMKTAPVGSVVEGLSRALQGGFGGWMAGEADRDELADEEKKNATLMDAITKARSTGDFSEVARALASAGQAGPAATLLFADMAQQRQQGRAADTTRLITGAGAPDPLAPGARGGFNIGNIRMPGGQPGFRTFGTPDAAIAAVRDNLRAYPQAFNGGQPMNLLQIGARWAPKGDGNNDPVAWARNVATVAGIDPQRPIDMNDPIVMARIAKGIHAAEFGRDALLPDEVYVRGVGGGPRAQAAPGVTPIANPPQPQVGAAPPMEGGGVDDSGQDRGMAPGFAPPTVRLPPPQRLDDGSAERAAYERLVRSPDAQHQALALKYYEMWQAKATRAQQAQIDAAGKEPPMMGRTDQGGVALVEGALDAERARETAKAQGRGVLQPGVDPNTGAPGLVNPVTGEFKPAAPPFNEAQGRSATFADRMSASERNLREVEGQGTNAWGAFLERLGMPGNYLQSPEYQRYEQARRDFINAQLRRESGAVISPDEFANAEKQYFPRPGDSPAVIEQKRRNRQIALEGMARDSGPAYKPRQDAPAGGDPLSQARDAIAKGAPRDKVIERLRAMGIDPGGL